MGLEARGFFSLKGVGRVRKENGWFKGVVSVWKDWVGFGSRVEGVLMRGGGCSGLDRLVYYKRIIYCKQTVSLETGYPIIN